MVVGVGGLGHLALQYAQIFGTRTIAVDVEDEKLQLAKDLGADYVVDARGDQWPRGISWDAGTAPSGDEVSA
jgi:propanol-preferring alcohol dehydrogenase